MGAVPLNFLVERVPDHLIPGPCDSLMPCPPPAILVQRAPGGAQASESPKFPGISAAGVHGLRFEDAHTFCFTEERKATTCGKALLRPHGQSRGHPVWPPGLRFPTQHPTCCWAAASGNSAPLGCPAPIVMQDLDHRNLLHSSGGPNPNLGCQQGRGPPRSPGGESSASSNSGLSRAVLSLPGSCSAASSTGSWPFSYACVSVFSSYKDIRHIG